MVLTSDNLDNFKKYLGDDLMEKEAKELLETEQNKYTRDDEVIALYSAYSRDELERNTILEDERIEAREKGYNEGIERGIKQGIKQGVEQGVEKVARQLKINNVDINIIVSATGLSKDEIINL